MLGSNTWPQLQIVPTLSSYNVYTTNGVQLFGTGLVEGASTYSFAAASVVDTATGSGADVFNSGGIDNSGVNVSEPVHGFGSVTATTAGGTSAPLTLNELEPGDGLLRDVAFAGGQLWVVDNGSPAKIHRINMATGQDLQAITLDATFGATNFFGGMQVTTATFALNGTSVPTGSLLLFDGQTNPDRVIAVNPGTGAVISTLILTKNYDMTAGVFDPTSGHLFLIDRSVNPNRIVEIDPATGLPVAGTGFNAPFNAGEAGMALDASGNLWYGSDQRYRHRRVQAQLIGHLRRDGTASRQPGAARRGSGRGVRSCIDTSGNLLVASTQGVVYRINVALDPAITAPTVSSVVATATNGTPPIPGQPSATVGQVIEVDGTNFGSNSEVVFNTASGPVAVAPLVVNAAGTAMEVEVPTGATTGNMKVVNIGRRDLGYQGSFVDAIYRNVTLSFTPSAATSTISFTGSGLQGVSDESWGLDNVAVSNGSTTVFSDNFQSGANAAWSSATTDNSYPGVFSQFSGRFSANTQTLSLSGLTAGQPYTLSFDLYIIDLWDGLNTSAGPDRFLVSADGTPLMNELFSAFPSQVQSYNAATPVNLQIV